jgi:hypothetical protein
MVAKNKLDHTRAFFGCSELTLRERSGPAVRAARFPAYSPQLIYANIFIAQLHIVKLCNYVAYRMYTSIIIKLLKRIL